MTDARLATQADAARQAQVLAAAFSPDPTLCHLLPLDVPSREARLRRFLGLEVTRSRRHGGAWTTTDGDATALWFPPGRWKPTTAELLRQTPAFLATLRGRARLAARAADAMAAHHPRQEHWYLALLAVVPARQGTGLGSALLAPVLARCDAEGLPAYLEATGPENRALYRRHGFVDRDELPLPDDGPTLYPMWREPVRVS